MADQLWLVTRIREEEEYILTKSRSVAVDSESVKRGTTLLKCLLQHFSELTVTLKSVAVNSEKC